MPTPQLTIPANYPISSDIEDRRGNQSIVAPAPSLLDNIKSGLNTVGTKVQMFNTGLHHNMNPYWQAPVDPNFYHPGQDAASFQPPSMNTLPPIPAQRLTR